MVHSIRQSFIAYPDFTEIMRTCNSDANSDQDGLGMIDSEWLQTVPTVLRELLDVTEKIQSTSKAATDLQVTINWIPLTSLFSNSFAHVSPIESLPKAKAESSLMRQVFAAYKGNMTDEEWKQLAITIAEREKTVRRHSSDHNQFSPFTDFFVDCRHVPSCQRTTNNPVAYAIARKHLQSQTSYL